MKKSYAKPFAEKIEFDYNDQVVVASGTCTGKWINQDPTGGTDCTKWTWWSDITSGK